MLEARAHLCLWSEKDKMNTVRHRIYRILTKLNPGFLYFQYQETLKPICL